MSSGSWLVFHDYCSGLNVNPFWPAGLIILLFNVLCPEAFLQSLHTGSVPGDATRKPVTISETWRHLPVGMAAVISVIAITILYPGICIYDDRLRAIFIAFAVCMLAAIAINPWQDEGRYVEAMIHKFFASVLFAGVLIGIGFVIGFAPSTVHESYLVVLWVLYGLDCILVIIMGWVSLVLEKETSEPERKNFFAYWERVFVWVTCLLLCIVPGPGY